MGCGVKSCVKGTAVFLNIIILLAGAAALALGLWVLLDENNFFASLYPYMVDMKFADTAVLRHAAIALSCGGAATICFALLGIAAACTRCIWLTGIYIAVVVLVIAVQVAALVLGIVFKRELEDKMDTEITQQIKTKYSQELSSKFITTFFSLQKTKQCCGWFNGSDYLHLKPGQFNNPSSNDTVIPQSCCKMKNVTQMHENCTTDPMEGNSYLLTGCKAELFNMFEAYQGSIIGLSAGIAAIEFLLLVVSIISLAHSDSNKYAMS